MDDEFDLEQLQKAMDAAIHSVPSELSFEEFVEWAEKIYNNETYVKKSGSTGEDE